MDYNDFTRIDNSPSAIREYLADSGLAARKRWGQNFLVDTAARQALLAALAPAQPPGREQHIWEIGPGLGAMTAGLLQAGVSVTAFEIDYGMVRHLKRRFPRHIEESFDGGGGSDEEGAFPAVGGVDCASAEGPEESERPVLHLVSGDAVKTVPRMVREYGRPDGVLGNLPYNAAGPILWALLTTAEPIPRIVCTVQREVAERMLAAPGSRNFGPFAVLCSLEYEAREIRKLSGGCFYPRPHVESSAVLLRATGAELPVGREKILRLTNIVFTQPRKTISNNLKSLAGTRECVTQRLAAAQVSGNLRPSALSIADLVRLSQEFEDVLTV